MIRRATLLELITAAPITRSFLLLLLLQVVSGCAHLGGAERSPPEKDGPRAQLSIGYSLLYQEADGIPKLKWLLMFKDKTEEMGQTTRELIAYYQGLGEEMKRLSQQYPAMHIDVTPMSPIESEERKAIGLDQAKDFAPVAGKTGVDFEREALLMFYDALNEQRHLVGVMLKLEPDAGLQKFLERTKAQLELRYQKVGALLNRRYFSH